MRHGKLIGIYNEPPRWSEGPAAMLLLGVPLALLFAILIVFL